MSFVLLGILNSQVAGGGGLPYFQTIEQSYGSATSQATNIVTDPTGGFWVYGYATGSNVSSTYVAHYADDLTVDFQGYFDQTLNPYWIPNAVCDADGNLYVWKAHNGSTYGPSGSAYSTIFKLRRSDFFLDWQMTYLYGLLQLGEGAMVIGSDGNLFVGSRRSSDQYAVHLNKINITNGALIKRRRWSGGAVFNGALLKVNPAGNLVFAFRYNGYVYLNEVNNNLDMVIQKKSTTSTVNARSMNWDASGNLWLGISYGGEPHLFKLNSSLGVVDGYTYYRYVTEYNTETYSLYTNPDGTSMWGWGAPAPARQCGFLYVDANFNVLTTKQYTPANNSYLSYVQWRNYAPVNNGASAVMTGYLQNYTGPMTTHHFHVPMDGSLTGSYTWGNYTTPATPHVKQNTFFSFGAGDLTSNTFTDYDYSTLSVENRYMETTRPSTITTELLS